MKKWLLEKMNQEANTKAEGMRKLLVAYLVSPLLAAVIFGLMGALLLGLLSPILTSEGDPQPKLIDIIYASPKIFSFLFLEISKYSFLVGTPTLILWAMINIKYKLLTQKEVRYFALVGPVMLALFLCEGSPRIFLNLIIAFGIFFTFGAFTIADLFWYLGIKNNNWLKNA